MSNVILRDYQDSMISDTRAALARYKRVLLQAPTGAGKTVLASYMFDAAASKGKRCWFVMHRQELVEGTMNTFNKFGIPYGVVANGFMMNPFAQIQICSIQTLVNRMSRLPDPDMIGWDECHHLGAASWQKVMDRYSRAFHVGLSATPVRLDGKGLGRWFDYMVRGPSVRWLIDNGHLSQYRLFAPQTPDLHGVHTSRGDYDQAEIDEIMRGKAIVGGIVRHWNKNARGLRTIGFAPSIKASKEYVDAFRQAGIVAVHLDGTMSRDDRRKAASAFADGHIDLLWNVDLFGEGFDLASLADRDVTIEAAILCRPTQSLGLHLQQIGRALRKKSNPAVILDHSGNTLKHGLPCDDREWTLADREKQTKGDGEAAVNVRQCPKCYFVHRPAPQCANCGHVYKVKERVVDVLENDLAEVDVVALRRKRMAEQARAKTLEELIELGRSRGYKHPIQWAAKVYSMRMAGRSAE